MSASVLALILMIISMTGHASCTWCVCKDMSDAVLQRTLDYACGAGADCNPIHQNAPCFMPNTVKAHCSYAVNSYFQKKAQAAGSCDFAGTATIAASDPSSAGCSYPASVSSTSTSTGTTSSTPVTVTPAIGTPTTGTPTTATPSITTTPTTATSYNSTTPSNGVLGGIGTGTTPTTASTNTDYTDEGFRLQPISFASFFMALLVSGPMLFMS